MFDWPLITMIVMWKCSMGENILHDTVDIAYQFRNDAEDGNEDENENPGETVIQKGKQM